jgi:hypothetical protein
MGMTPREDRMANHIPRREFVITLGAVAATLPIGALAQQAGKVYRIGFLANDPAISTQRRAKPSSMACARAGSSKVRMSP